MRQVSSQQMMKTMKEAMKKKGKMATTKLKSKIIPQIRQTRQMLKIVN
jgi:hypothetical protein